MAGTTVEVVVQIAGEDVPAGRLWAHRRSVTDSATFSYFPEYLARADSYQLDPALSPHAGPQQTPADHPLFRAFSDAAPDGWGRRLIWRNQARLARETGTAKQSIGEIDYLLGVRDDLRQGALRFRDPETGTYLAEQSAGVPHLIELGRLLNAAEQVERDEGSDEDLRLLLEGGSSLGGARPKAHVIDNAGRLGIAKFPAPSGDDWEVVRWEAVALTLAHEAGVRVPRFSLHEIDGKPVLVSRRFDRDRHERIGYVSAMTMLEASERQQGSYLEIAEAIERHSPFPSVDLRELWRRITFSRLISNTDDHLRNHGFLRTSAAGWSLSPAFDLNPNPQPGRAFSTVIDPGHAENGVEVALALADLFRLTRDDATAVLAEVRRAISRWRKIAARMDLSQAEIERMSPAYEHDATA